MDVDIWSDIACPWCYVGKRRLEAALGAFEHRDEVQVRWHSFELDPNAPAEREGDVASNLASKYGTTPDRALAMLAQMTETAAGDGLEFHFERARSGNTFDGHRLIHLALECGLQDAMKERLMRAYLTEGELISDRATLRGLALEVGLPEEPVDELLAGERFAEEVRTDEYTASARDHGGSVLRRRSLDRCRRRAVTRVPARIAAPGLGGARIGHGRRRQR